MILSLLVRAITRPGEKLFGRVVCVESTRLAVTTLTAAPLAAPRCSAG